MDSTANALIDLQGVSFFAGGSLILTEVFGQVEKGDVLFIAGKSGSGKSTLLKIMAGLQYQTTGSVKIHGVDLKAALNEELLELHAKSGFVFQDSALISNLTIYDNLALPLRYRGELRESEIRVKIDSILTRFDLDDDRNNRPAALSMGERKMAGIARSLVTDPSLIYMDEPLASLDISRVHQVKEVLNECIKNKVTMVIIAHELEFLAEYAKRIWVIKNHTIAKDISMALEPNFVAQLESEII